MASVDVASEIGPLRSVLIHTPGNEILAVTPGTREDYLYDDIIDLESARSEHEVLASVLRLYADVFEVRDLLREVLDKHEARRLFVAGAPEYVSNDGLAERMMNMSAHDMLNMLIEGEAEELGPIATALNEKRRPPLTTFATRFTDTRRSTNST